MNVDKNFVTLARQQRIALERAAFTEGIDKVKEVLEREEVVVITQQEKINDVAKEVEIGIEEVIVTETNRAKEVESYKITRQNTQYQEKADSIAKGIERVRAPEIQRTSNLQKIVQRSTYARMRQKKDQSNQLKQERQDIVVYLQTVVYRHLILQHIKIKESLRQKQQQLKFQKITQNKEKS